MGEDDAYFQLVLAALDNSGIAIKLLDILKEAKFHPLEQQEIFKNISNHNNNDECMVSCTLICLLVKLLVVGVRWLNVLDICMCKNPCARQQLHEL